MSYIIYGLRLKGEVELRYIGLTGYTPESRLISLTRESRLYKRWRPLPTEGFRGWLHLNSEVTEAIELTRVETKAEAHAAERQMVELFVRLNHRLFNTWLVPAAVRKAA